MARTKSTRSNSSSSSSSKRSSSQSRGAGRSQGRSAQASSQNSSQRQQDAEGFSFDSAREFVESNVNLQTAGIALAGAGILALVSTDAGRSLIRTAASTVAKLATDNFGEYFGASSSDDQTEQRQKPSRQQANY